MDRDEDRQRQPRLSLLRHSTSGLINQGWKDSHDAIFHEDGTLAEPPIALAEVQAYVYAARRGMADLARRFGYIPEAERWAAAASALRERFDQDFGMDEEDCYALALDGDQRPCRVSNVSGLRQKAENLGARVQRQKQQKQKDLEPA